MNKIYAHSLVDLLRAYCDVPSALDTHVSGISADSRKVRKGDLFIAVSSSEQQVQDHIDEAVSLGANAILRMGDGGCRIYEDKAAVEICLPDLTNRMGDIVSRFYGDPSEDLKVIGVTGTNGKTSVANYIAQYLSHGDQKCGVMGTLGYGIVGQGMVDTGYTTPDVVGVHRNLACMRDAGAEMVVMEVSSHGLCQRRVDAVKFYGAVFTNLSRDHLDYHQTMDSYASAKRELFRTPGLVFAVLNKDDDYFSDFKSALASGVNAKSYSRKSSAADISVLAQEYTAKGLSALLKTPYGQVSIMSPLLGAFNLDNLLAVVAVASAVNDLADMEARVESIRPVAGRMDVVQHPDKPVVVVDYAHTPDALENVLKSLRPLCAGKLKLIFGCGGDRDKGKRAEMAKVAENLADEIIVTDDNPRSESPRDIIADIMSGFGSDSKVAVIHERRSAISQMLNESVDGDLILIAGKGHESYQEVNGQRHYFNDLETVRELMLGVEQSSQDYEVVHD